MVHGFLFSAHLADGPAWRRLLTRHQGKTLVEFCRRPKIHERVAGFIVGFSESLILLHQFDWNTFQLDGYTILRGADIEKKRFFSRQSYWQVRALQKCKIRPRPLAIRLSNWQEAVEDIAKQYPLLSVKRELRYPSEGWLIGSSIEVTPKRFVLDNISPNAEWTGPYRLKTNDITRLGFGDGYERALASAAPKVRPKKRRL